MKIEIQNELISLLKTWFPKCIDKEYGGYLCNYTYDWKAVEPLDKFIVTQSRILWTASKAGIMFPNDHFITEAADIGYQFIRDYFWDSEFGGFHSMRSVSGGYSEFENYQYEKRAYGNAFAIYALSAYYKLTNKSESLELAKKGFYWIEDHAFDKVDGGYFQFLTREGKPFGDELGSKVKDAIQGELGYKDQNSSIHLLEAYTELYSIWKNELLKERLEGLLHLLRETIINPKGYLQLFFTKDWKHLSFSQQDPREWIHDHLDHISFGHDVETGFLMLEASHTLGWQNDEKTYMTAKKMVDHALTNGWDNEKHGFFDGGYYPFELEKCKIIMDEKVWWAQAECMNMLLLMSKISVDENEYQQYAQLTWEYIKKFLLDYEYGGWFEGGLDKQPDMKTQNKANLWKGPYHDGRALMNCLKILDPESDRDGKMSELIEHWRRQPLI